MSKEDSAKDNDDHQATCTPNRAKRTPVRTEWNPDHQHFGRTWIGWRVVLSQWGIVCWFFGPSHSNNAKTWFKEDCGVIVFWEYRMLCWRWCISCNEHGIWEVGQFSISLIVAHALPWIDARKTKARVAPRRLNAAPFFARERRNFCHGHRKLFKQMRHFVWNHFIFMALAVRTQWVTRRVPWIGSANTS